MNSEAQNAVAQFRNMQKALNGGCHDGYCVIEKPTGMHTNGGCGCLYRMDFHTQQRVGHMLRAAQKMADHIEADLVPLQRKPREWWINMHSSGMCTFYKTEDGANAAAASRVVECVHVREVLDDE